jgi:hypothetical protein
LAVAALVSTGLSCTAENKLSPKEDILPPNQLSAAEEAEGWILLFNGRDFAGWRVLGRRDVPPGHWTIEGGALKKVPRKEVPLQEDGQPLVGGDLMTVENYRDFELSLEWKISPGGNSGIKYNVSEDMSTAFPPEHAALGFEYQILDDTRHPDALLSVTHQAGALYDLISAEGKQLLEVGEYNTARIIFRGGHGEHWLNGVKVLEYELGTPEMEMIVARSKYARIPGFAEKRDGHIVLQDHTDAAWFRNIKLRILEP